MRLALVGCGAAAEHLHLPAVRAVLGDEPIALVDADAARARALASRGDVVATSHEAVDADAAIVAVPNDFHVAVAGDLLRAGVDVLCEKPLGRTAAEARTLAAAAEDGSATLGVAHFRRLLEATRRGVDEIAALGALRRFAVEEGSVYAWSAQSASTLDRARAGGGVLLDVGTHVLDQLRVLLGELELHAYRDDAHGGVEADCLVELRARGVGGTVELSRTRSLGSSLVVEGERGAVTLPLAPEPGPDFLGSFETQLRRFLAGDPVAGAADAIAVAELVDRCYAERQPLPEPWLREVA